MREQGPVDEIGIEWLNRRFFRDTIGVKQGE